VSAKPEGTFTRAVHKHLPGDVYFVKNNNPYTGGLPDCWYSAKRADLWVEYKFVPKVPAKADIVPNLSALQSEWLRNRHREGRNVAVIVGCPEGGVILRNLKWDKPISRNDFVRDIKTRAELAAWIYNEVGAKP
jgi:hypothetical protein